MNTFKLESFKQIDTQIVTNEANLSICLTANGFIFAIVDNKFCLNAIGEFQVDLSGSMTQVMTNLKACFSSINIHIFNFNKVRIVCSTQRNTWVPYKLYDNTKDREYLKVVAPIYPNDTIVSNVCAQIDAVNIFATSIQQYSGMKITIPKAQFISPSQLLTEYAFDVSSLMQNTLVINKHGQEIDFAIFKGDTFTLSNSFKYNVVDDLIYLLLYTLQEVDINTAEVNTLITGDAYTDQELSALKHYIKNVSYANPTTNITIPATFEGIDLQKYFFVIA